VRASAFRACLALLVLAAAPREARADDDPFGPVKPRPGSSKPAPADAPPAIEALRPWLAHEDWVCRALAARELSKRSEDGVVSMLAAQCVRETEPFVLATCMKSLAGLPRDDLLAEGGPPLAARVVASLRHPHPGVAARALAIVKVLPPLALGDAIERYEDWWARGKDGFAAECGLAAERRQAARAAKPAPAPVHEPGETVTAGRADRLERYADLDRIHREGLELVVCLDQTGSMGDVIAAAKAGIVDLMRRMRRLAPKFRVGLVTYDDGAYDRFALTTDEAYAEKMLGKVGAGGGGDMEEGVDQAIDLALRQEKMAWSRAAMRVIVVVGDAPPHEEDVAHMVRAIAKARADDRFEVPIRLDTISTVSGNGADADGYVPYFREIAHRGGGTAVLASDSRVLMTEIMVASFGPAWREPIRALLADVAAFDALAPPPPKKR
jgi:Mg-chelatase subunit ChlD